MQDWWRWEKEISFQYSGILFEKVKKKAMNFVPSATPKDYTEIAEILKEEAKREKGREAQASKAV